MNSKIYSSLSIGHVNNATLTEMADKFAAANEKNGITGYLFFFNDRYLQFIESEDDAVVRLMEEIRKDARHIVLNEKSFTYEHRLLPGWCMKAIDKKAENLEYAEEVINQHLLMTELTNVSNEEISDELFVSIQRVAAIKSRMMLEES